METYNQIVAKLEGKKPLYAHFVSEIAEEIFKAENQVTTEEYRNLIKLFHLALKKWSFEDILFSRIDYAIKISQSEDILYEEMVKIYSLCIDCHILKALGCKTNFDLSIFYLNLHEVIKKNSKYFSDIQKRFFPDFIQDFNLLENFLGD